MKYAVERFGTLPDGRHAEIFMLDGGEGVTATISNFGGIIVSLTAPDRDGKSGEVGLGRRSLQEYLDKPSYFGALIGRVANRIRDGKFCLDGKTYSLWTNQKGVHLHGGREGFNRKLWKAEVDSGGLHLEYLSPDGEENYPGTLTARVTYTVDGPYLRIDYQANTDQPTIVNLTNHEFFNLNGGRATILSHRLRIRADCYTPVDERQVPTGEIAPVAGTPLDFGVEKAIGHDIGLLPGGYDHNYLFAQDAAADEDPAGDWLVEVFEPESGRTLSMATTEPCVQFYSGNFLDGSDIGRGGVVYKKHYGFCLEAQKAPDAINHSNFPSTVLRPGETYRQTTVYRFGVQA